MLISDNVSLCRGCVLPRLAGMSTLSPCPLIAYRDGKVAGLSGAEHDCPYTSIHDWHLMGFWTQGWIVGNAEFVESTSPVEVE
jgi:ribosome modulation factor